MSDERVPVIHSWRPLVEGGCWVIAAIVLWVMSIGFNEPLPMFEWGPAFWPRMLLVGILIAGLGLAATAFMAPGGEPGAIEAAESLNDIPSLTSWSERIHVALIFAIPVLYVYAMHKMGFLLVTPIFLIVYMFVFGVRRWKPLLIVSLSVYAAVVLVFVKLIFTPLPQGAGVFYTLNGHLLGLLL